MVRHIVSGLFLVTAVCTLLTVSPPAAQAIPSAGTYVFSGPSLTGTFHSTGSSLDVWSFTDPTGYLWSNSIGTQSVTFNDAINFSLVGPSFAEIAWMYNDGLGVVAGAMLHGFQAAGITSSYSVSTVPEPFTGLLLLAGLGLLGTYAWRQQRQTGVQVE